ncbi:hypothetical protein BDY19DRAFT_543893 [Irpex rosettiformis]|uniref:Uncharacterized protein n=1 Tax=Irpex rosettiformis TaxID=378272 RepID=A0ACB8TQN5_9APHY|nr:hypothetical protein BDY19DRAFT_543893 [Irpex rosettiformis]
MVLINPLLRVLAGSALALVGLYTIPLTMYTKGRLQNLLERRARTPNTLASKLITIKRLKRRGPHSSDDENWAFTEDVAEPAASWNRSSIYQLEVVRTSDHYYGSPMETKTMTQVPEPPHCQCAPHQSDEPFLRGGKPGDTLAHEINPPYFFSTSSIPPVFPHIDSGSPTLLEYGDVGRDSQIWLVSVLGCVVVGVLVFGRLTGRLAFPTKNNISGPLVEKSLGSSVPEPPRSSPPFIIAKQSTVVSPLFHRATMPSGETLVTILPEPLIHSWLRESRSAGLEDTMEARSTMYNPVAFLAGSVGKLDLPTPIPAAYYEDPQVLG